MENKIQNQEEVLLNAFKIETLEERLEMAPWSDPDPSPTTGIPADQQVGRPQ